MGNTPIEKLSKVLAEPAPRRSVLAALAGAVFAGRFRRAEAVSCRATNSVCREHSNCCSGVCGETDRTGRRRCECTVEGEPCGRPSGECCGELICASQSGGAICRTNAQPTATSYSFNFHADTMSQLDCIPFWMNGSDPDGDTLSFRVTRKPTYGTVKDRNGSSKNARALCYDQFYFNQSTIRDFNDVIGFTAVDPYGATSSQAIVSIYVDERIPR